MSDTPPEQSLYPRSGQGWALVIFLTLAYVFSWVDRYVLGLLIEPIKADFGFTDTEMGLLTGVAFGLLYATLGLPIGWLADRKRRTWIVAAGVFVWSAATLLTGFAKNFWYIFVARMSVAAGEATLSPCAMSMISDSFPPDKRGKPIAFYTAALSLGAGIASLVTAGVLKWANSVEAIVLPIVGVLKPWQTVFVVVGAPGLLLAIVFFFWPEPRRVEHAGEKQGGSFAEVLKFVGTKSLAYFSVVAIVGAMVVTAYSQGWLAAAFERTWGWTADRFAFYNAIVLLAFGPATVILSGSASDRLYARGRRDAPFIIMIIGLIILVPSSAMVMLVNSPEMAFVMIAFSTIGIAMVSAVGPTALVNMTPGAIRAQTIALYYLIISLVGMIVGQTAVGLMSDLVFGNENLRYAVAAVPVIFGVPAFLFSFVGLAAYRCALPERFPAERV